MFCPRCGSIIPDSVSFCPNCGNNVAPQNGTQPQFVTYIKPKIPGRGFGISSMVLGIVGLYFSFMMFVTAINLSSIGFGLLDDSFIVGIIIYSSLPILAVSFSVAAKNRGYINKISSSGLIMGVIGLALSFLALVIVLFS